MSKTKAEIVNDLNESEKVVCMFNPNEYIFSKQNNWSERPAKGKNVARLEYGGGAPATLKLQLFFDTYEQHEGFQVGQDVRKLIAPLWKMMEVSPKNKNPSTGRGEPPYCRFKWGDLWSFKAVILSINQRFTLFLPDGTPVRATLDVTFRQIRDEGQYPRQNPTSGGNPGEQIYTVCEGDTLAGIAYRMYGDPNAWRHLALRNHILDPLYLRTGSTLVIPALRPDW